MRVRHPYATEAALAVGLGVKALPGGRSLKDLPRLAAMSALFVVNRFRLWRTYRQSLRELYTLDDAILRDLAIGRSSLPNLAWEEAQRRLHPAARGPR